jgi:type II secretory pathway component PulF
MATFEYNALTSSDRLMKGTIEAGSHDQAAKMLQEMELTVNEITQARPKMPKTAIGRNEFLLFNQQLASIAKAGIPLEKGLRELAKDIASRPVQKLTEGIASDLEAGVSIEQAFEKRQKDFPPLYSRILKAGVQTGRLSEMLTSLNRHIEVANRTRKIIFEAVSYPAIVLALGATIITAIFLLVIPRLGSLLTDMAGVELPALTRLFINMAKNTVSIWVGIVFLIVAILVILTILSGFAAGRRLKESLFLRIPVIGRLYHVSTLSRLAEAMAMLVAAGADMSSCLRLSAQASGSEKLVLESDILAGHIEQGANILEAGQFCKIIPRLFLYSVQLGMQRNELQDNLYSLGQMYAEQARCGQARLQAVLLPIMLICVGGFLAIAILSMFLPMVKIITSLSAV